MGLCDFLCIFSVFILIFVYLYWFLCIYIDFLCICFVALEISTVSAFCMLWKDYTWFDVSVVVRAPWQTRYMSSGHDYWMLMAVSCTGKGKNPARDFSNISNTTGSSTRKEYILPYIYLLKCLLWTTVRSSGILPSLNLTFLKNPYYYSHETNTERP